MAAGQEFSTLEVVNPGLEQWPKPLPTDTGKQVVSADGKQVLSEDGKEVVSKIQAADQPYPGKKHDLPVVEKKRFFRNRKRLWIVGSAVL